jgi:hypothetical protein
MVKMAAGWMPARIGADESGAAGAFLSFGLPAASGLTLALARRTRDLLASFIGLAWLAWGHIVMTFRHRGNLPSLRCREETSKCKL